MPSSYHLGGAGEGRQGGTLFPCVTPLYFEVLLISGKAATGRVFGGQTVSSPYFALHEALRRGGTRGLIHSGPNLFQSRCSLGCLLYDGTVRFLTKWMRIGEAFLCIFYSFCVYLIRLSAHVFEANIERVLWLFKYSFVWSVKLFSTFE